RKFDPAPAATELTVAVTGAPAATGASGGGGAGTTGTTGSGQRDGGSTGSSGGRPGPVTSSTSSGSHDIVPNPAMRGRLGRLVVAYPEKVAARIEVFRPGEAQAVATGYGDQSFDLLPGTYEVSISGKRITGVAVRSASDTKIKVGVLRVNASDGTRINLTDPASKKDVTGGYGTQVFGLPIGEIGVQIAGQTENVVINAGQVTEF
ncbi:MAG TPA: hypothetical protein VF405_16285, partial [Gammaproteobacteria bacterium]